METLTKRQQTIMDFLKQEIKRSGYPPSIREIGDAVGLGSTSTVHAHLETLERRGYIRRSPTRNRSIEILEENFYVNAREIINVPIVSKIYDSVLDESNIEDYFPLPVDFLKSSPCFMFQARGITIDGIHDRDLLLIEQTTDVADNDIVIILQDDEAVFTYFAKNVGDCKIFGKIIGLYRRY